MEAWPVSLPAKPLAASFTQNLGAGAGLLRSGNAAAYARQRHRFREVLTPVSLAWSMSAVQLQAFKAWYVGNIGNGRNFFTIGLIMDIGTRTVTARFVADSAPRYSPFPNTANWLVKAALEVIDRPDLEAVQVS